MSLHNKGTEYPEYRNGEMESGGRESGRNCTETAYACWLDRIPTIGTVSAKRLLDEYQSAERIYRLSFRETQELAERGLLKPAQAEKLREWQTLECCEPHRLYEAMSRRGIWAVRYGDRDYPKRLSSIPDPPHILYVKGNVPDESKPCISVVGARLCSDYGRYATHKFASVLAGAGVQIISGMALGIDGISHKAAMDAGGKTFAVLGCGVDVCYPEQNRDIYAQIQTKGGVISEYPPGTAPRAGLFPRRNRIISGLADLLLVIEARKKSGTLITVDAALEQGKEVYALPGRVTDALSGGCNQLIAQGAGIVTSPQQLLEELSEWMEYRGGICAGGREAEEMMRQTEEKDVPRQDGKKEEPEHLVQALLSEEGRTLDELMSGSALTPGVFGEALMRLCISGAAVCRQGRYYRNDSMG